MPSVDITVTNKLGLHARASAKLTQLASKHRSDIHIARGSRRVNAKSIMGVMMLAAGLGSVVTVDAEGEDADEALEQIRALFDNKFGESD
ncbi:HPr family phosphocarrier protein [Pigmentiphaga litoralis]|uniref:Phosphocarrier protein n=1 Tax=Pigmentiphaga litoralis TaxID=516702 RepID=A0A7Y9IPT1_9BURK|nr:HPr family phosphocarrier protein [Pigmentiphaga litoralis]NYE25533.1 phosphocarrier protein [Pigmentiphaga litoralis]NYE80855.1 phosphocarrier protein [Pigmentiphaga litoralis]